MNTNEAYQKVMETIQQLKDTGIKIEITTPKTVDNKELVEKYKDRLDVNLWKHIELHPTTKFQKDLIYQRLIQLTEIGIIFDTGIGYESIDWEIDWSLRISEDQDDIKDSQRMKTIVFDQFSLPAVTVN